MEKVVAIVQARMSSRRLPGKCMLPLAGKPLIVQILNRIKKARSIDQIVLATSEDISDDILEYEVKKSGVDTYRGNLDDVLDRIYQAAEIYKADIVVRICADNAFVSPDLLNQVVGVIKQNEGIYASTMLERTFPAGVNAEAFTFLSFKEIWRKSNTKYQREHVTPLYYAEESNYKIINIAATGILRRPEIKLSIDTFADYRVVNSIYEKVNEKDGIIDLKDAIFIGDKLNLWKINGPPKEFKIA